MGIGAYHAHADTSAMRGMRQADSATFLRAHGLNARTAATSFWTVAYKVSPGELCFF